MSLILLLNPISQASFAKGGGGIGTPIPPPFGGLITPILVGTKMEVAVPDLVDSSTGWNLEYGMGGGGGVSMPALTLHEGWVADGAKCLLNNPTCKVRISGKPLALLGAKGTGHSPWGIPHPPHAMMVWQVIGTASKMRVLGVPVARLGDSTTCGHKVVVGHPKLRTA